MSEPRVLTDVEFGEMLHRFKHTAFRLELQRVYLEPSEAELYAAFLRGEPEPPSSSEQLRTWYARVAEHISQGKRIERVRVQEDPPTDYQRFERWIGRWNLEAGEAIRYMTREHAYEVGLLPAAGATDWWLLDSSMLVAMGFDSEGRRVRNEFITDPAVVIQACMWRDLAVHHSALAENQDVAA